MDATSGMEASPTRRLKHENAERSFASLGGQRAREQELVCRAGRWAASRGSVGPRRVGRWGRVAWVGGAPAPPPRRFAMASKYLLIGGDGCEFVDGALGDGGN